MRESEMRQRIEGFLKRRMQGMLAPALGLGLAAAGCVESAAVYSAPNPDAPIGHVEDAPGGSPEAVYSAPFARDAYPADTFVAKDSLPTPVDVSLIDVAVVPDASKDAASEAVPGMDVLDAGAGIDSGADLGSMTTKYMAQLPDAGRDLGATPLYMAPLYMASIPLG
jgi:hypothetical protein